MILKCVGSSTKTTAIKKRKNSFRIGCMSLLSLFVITIVKYAEKINKRTSKIGVTCQPKNKISLYDETQRTSISRTQSEKKKVIKNNNLPANDLSLCKT
jgi:hypothetical protein